VENTTLSGLGRVRVRWAFGSVTGPMSSDRHETLCGCSRAWLELFGVTTTRFRVNASTVIGSGPLALSIAIGLRPVVLGSPPNIIRLFMGTLRVVHVDWASRLGDRSPSTDY